MSPRRAPGTVARALAAALLAAALWAPAARAVVFEPRDFPSPEAEARYKHMTRELRCLVCQNQDIADSNAPLAHDLRREVFRMIGEGRSDEEIVDYMVKRYGDFVLYRPPFKGLTVALWAGPAVLAALGLALLVVVLRRRRAAEAAAPRLSPEEQARLDALMARAQGAAEPGTPHRAD